MTPGPLHVAQHCRTGILVPVERRDSSRIFIKQHLIRVPIGRTSLNSPSRFDDGSVAVLVDSNHKSLTMEGFEIRTAIVGDLPQLQELECEAGQIFRTVPALAHFADGGSSMTIDRQRDLVQKESVWVVATKDTASAHGISVPCAFLAADQVDQSLHIFELSVSPDYQRRGFARRLIDTAVKHAHAMGLKHATLTTDRYVPWNGPMYTKCGFNITSPDKLGPEHVKIVNQEQEDGLDMARRCMMVINVNGNTTCGSE